MLADGVAALTATYAVMMALYHRDTRRGPDGGSGQLIDINLIEPLFRREYARPTLREHLGITRPESQ